MIYKTPVRVDTNNVNIIDKEIKELTLQHKDENLTIDMIDTQYISSACLRVFLMNWKVMRAKGHKFNLINTNETVNEVLKVTGLQELLMNDNEKTR